jgi:flagellar hook assembly protein FlgD
MHSWSTTGLKNISVTARCEVHQNKVNTSDNLEIDVQESSTGINNSSLDEFSFRILNNNGTCSGSPVIISYSVPARSYVSISVYNMQGQLVRSLISSHHDNGKYETEWNGKDDNGNSAGSGVYFYIFSAKDYYSVQKGVLAE